MTTHSKAENSEPLRILVVDDNEAAAQTFGWMLEVLGHNVRLAYDGPGAISAAQSFAPQIVIMDINLPGMNGYEACQKLRADPELENSVLIAQTGWDQPEHRERSRKAGFHYHMVKPVTLDRMESLLASLNFKGREAQSGEKRVQGL
jgi:CheY-like chemotaxis protein